MPKKKNINDFYKENQKTIDYIYNDILENLREGNIQPKYIKKIDYDKFVNFVYKNSYKF